MNRAGAWTHMIPDEHEEGRLCDSALELLESPICQVEFLRASDDGTWDTLICEVPPKLSVVDEEEQLDAGRVKWAEKVLGSQVQHRKVVLWAVVR